MYNFKYETHLHTSEASDCAESSGAELVDYYKAAGYAGFVVTDHFFNGNTCIPEDLTWEERVNLFCKGYENAAARGKAVGFDVFFGFEYNHLGTEFLVYGLGKTWLTEHPEIMHPDLKTALRLIRNSGGFTVHAHPFREAGYIDMIRLVPGLTDAVEILNGGNMFRDPLFNERASRYASMYGFPRIAGTDMHKAGEFIYGGIAAENRLTDIDSFIRTIKKEEYEIIWNGTHPEL